MQHTRLAAASVEDLARGYAQSTQGFQCLHCACRFAAHEIHAVDGRLLNAEGAAIAHVHSAHGGAFAALMDLDARASGLSDVQRTVLKGMHDGQPDARIGEALGNRAASTVRNHRFQLREREREARIFLAAWSLLPAPQEAAKTTQAKEGIAMIFTFQGGRVEITHEDLRRFKERFMKEGVLRVWPKREKQRVILAIYAVRVFEPNRRYTEKEVNALLEPFAEAYFVNLRRYLVDYGFIGRERDGSAYWRLAEPPVEMGEMGATGET